MGEMEGGDAVAAVGGALTAINWTAFKVVHFIWHSKQLFLLMLLLLLLLLLLFLLSRSLSFFGNNFTR